MQATDHGGTDGGDHGRVYFLDAEDATELDGALRAEDYEVSSRTCEGPGAARWLLEVRPDDDGLVAMVDVYGGWLPEEA